MCPKDPARVTMFQNPISQRRRRRPRLRYMDDIETHLRNIGARACRRKALDRDLWRTILERDDVDDDEEFHITTQSMCIASMRICASLEEKKVAKCRLNHCTRRKEVKNVHKHDNFYFGCITRVVACNY